MSVDGRMHVSHAECMATTIQIRNVPESVSRRLKVRAASAGQSLSEYVLAELTVIAERPTLREVTDRASGRTPLSVDAAAHVRAARDERSAQLLAVHMGAD